ncbi:MAG: hypothetical protein N3D73_00585 [Candidatus Diapherotrites archaeon]|nr:hypothetical protein [Candidatus Diapherotrites archaeon]
MATMPEAGFLQLKKQEIYDKPTTTDEIIIDDRSDAEKVIDGTKEFLSKYKFVILLIIIIAAISLFLYDYFIGSYRDVIFEIKNTEGENIAANVKIYDESNKIVASFSGSRIISLKKGNYLVEIGQIGYIPKTLPLEVSDNENKVVVTILKGIDVELSVKTTAPDMVFQGESFKVVLEISNKTDQPQEITLISEGFNDKILMEKSFKVYLGPREIRDLNIEIKVDEKFPINEKTKEARVEGKIRLKYTNKSQEITFKVIEYKRDKIYIEEQKGNSYSPISQIVYDLNADNPVTKRIFIRNNNVTSLKNIKITIEKTSINYLRESLLDRLFTITPNILSEIDSNERLSIDITINPSIKLLDIPENQTSAKYLGKLIIKIGDFDSIQTLVDLTIRKPNIKLEISGINSKYTAKYNINEDKYTVSSPVTITNKGNVVLKNVRLNAFLCRYSITQNWSLSTDLSLGDSSWDKIYPNESKRTNLYIALPSTFPENQTIYCKGQIILDNPLYNEYSFTIPPSLTVDISEFSITTKK